MKLSSRYKTLCPVRMERLSLMVSSRVPSVSTPAMSSDRTGNPRAIISSFKKGAIPFAHVIRIELFRVNSDICQPCITSIRENVLSIVVFATLYLTDVRFSIKCFNLVQLF